MNREFNFRELIDNIDDLLRSQAEAKKIDFTIQIDDSAICGLVGDDISIRKILSKLIANAIKYTDTGFVKIRITSQGEEIVCHVADSGQGMNPEVASHIFDEKASDNQDNKLGMSDVKILVDEMGGNIAVHSRPGKGSTFTVKIPVTVYDEKLTYASSKNSEAQAKETDYSEYSFLYVDDAMINLMIFKSVLDQIHAKLDTVDNADGALAMCDTKKYDIIFLDHQMPDKDGIAMYNELRANTDGLNAKTPVVMVSGNADEASIAMYKEIGTDGYIAKPVLLDVLTNTIDRLMK